MDNTVKRKVVNNFVGFWNDTLYVRGKPPANRQLKRYLKGKLGSKVWEMISTSPTDVQFFTHYTNVPADLRRKELDSFFFRFITEYNGLLEFSLSIMYLSIWCMTEGLTLAEVRQGLETCFDSELLGMIPKELLSRHLSLSDFRLLPGNVAGANVRLRSVLNQRSVRQDEHRSDYEQDLSIALWECFKHKHLDEFRKMLSNNGDPAEAATNLRRVFQEKDSQAIRGIVLRILRETIEDLPDIHQGVRKLETQGRELSLTEKVLATVPPRHDDLVEPSPADLLEHIGISRDNTSEAEWQVFMMLSQKILDGEIEVGSKAGLSISAALGKDASRVRKTISRYRKRQLNR